MYVNGVNNFLCLIGTYALVFYLYDVLKSPIILCYYYVKGLLGLSNATLIEKYGQWAAITGSTDGIGKAYARELAFQGLNIILISRNQEKLLKVAKEIETDFYVKTKIIVADFTQQNAFKHVADELNKTSARILVNNVSLAKNSPHTLDEYSTMEIWNMINTNMGAVTLLSHYFIARLKSLKQNGIIVNLSSGAHYTTAPYVALYTATKTFVSQLTLALQAEARPYGIEVQLLKPFFVVTKINSYSKDIMRGGLFIPDPVTYAKAAVHKLGKVNDTAGYFFHSLQSSVANLMHWRLRCYFMKEFINFIISRDTIGCFKWKLIILNQIFIFLSIVAILIWIFVL